MTDSLVPETDKDNRFVVPIVQQPIAMIFNDQNKLTGFTIPIKDKDKLKRNLILKVTSGLLNQVTVTIWQI